MSKKKNRKEAPWKRGVILRPRRYTIRVTDPGAPLLLLGMVERYIDSRAKEEGLVGVTLERVYIEIKYRKKRGKKTAAA